MAKRIIKPVPVELDETPRQLIFGHNAFCSFEEATGGKNVLEELTQFRGLDSGRLPTMTTMRALLYAGLQNGKNRPSLEDVGNMINFDNMSEIYLKLSEAITSALPTPKEPEPDERPTTAPVEDLQ